MPKEAQKGQEGEVTGVQAELSDNLQCVLVLLLD